MNSRFNLNALQSIDGFIAAALVDIDSGMALATLGSGFNLELAAPGNAEVLKAKRKVATSLGLKDVVEDVLITLTSQYHLIRPLESNQSVFLYLVLDRPKANLAMARLNLKTFEQTLDFS